GWRLNADSHHDFTFALGDSEHCVRVAFLERGRELTIDGQRYNGASKAKTVREGRKWHVFHEGLRWTLALKEELAEIEADVGGSLAAPMPACRRWRRRPSCRRNGCRRWPITPRCSSASGASPASTTRCSRRT